ncbi:MAG: hypothetical protein CSB33_03880 [Desulfobacterales bacterium]|nr:MAG: hypothetical protein CSB33_03880 [Desulfobacterales bacterium]
MKSIDPAALDQVPGRRIGSGDTFFFRCYPGISCFNMCCRNLNLFLYPYDVMRLKNGLNMSSGEFLDRHTDVVLREGQYFPEVLLKMADNEAHTCPFVSGAGCTVYENRPDTCRFFPLDQGMLFPESGGAPEKLYWYRPFDFCQGRHERDEWTLDTWADDQDTRRYSRMTADWAELRGLFQSNPWGPDGPMERAGKMAFMAAYNVDAFREFVFGSSFLKRYHIKPAIKKKLKKNDADLLAMGLEWIRFFLFKRPPSLFRQK